MSVTAKNVKSVKKNSSMTNTQGTELRQDIENLFDICGELAQRQYVKIEIQHPNNEIQFTDLPKKIEPPALPSNDLLNELIYNQLKIQEADQVKKNDLEDFYNKVERSYKKQNKCIDWLQSQLDETKLAIIPGIQETLLHQKTLNSEL